MHLDHTAPADHEAIYSLLVRNDMDVPVKELALPVIEAAEGFVYRDGEKVVGWLGLARQDNGFYTLDITVDHAWRGKWFKREDLECVCKYVFTEQGGKGILVESYTPQTVSIALKLGFKMVDAEQDSGKVTLALTDKEYESL